MDSVLQAQAASAGRIFFWKWKNLDLLGLTMNKYIRVLFEQFKTVPFPELGKTVGDFALYDSLMAGTVSSYLDGANIVPEAIPIPDQETERMLKVLKKKVRPTRPEADFLNYAQLLNELRAQVAKAVKVG